MSPEMDLLDQLLGGDEPLNLALRVFGWPEDSQALESARRAIMMQLKEGLILIKRREKEADRDLPKWEWRMVLEEEANWLKQGRESEYYLSLTEKGARRVS